MSDSSTPPTPPPTKPRQPIDPHVQRRTLSIVIGFFTLGILLATVWVSREIRRVSRIERFPPTPPHLHSPSNTPPPSQTQPSNEEKK